MVTDPSRLPRPRSPARHPTWPGSPGRSTRRGRFAVPGNGEAGEAVWSLLAGGEFGVSTRQAAVGKREAEDQPGLLAVVSILRTLAG